MKRLSFLYLYLINLQSFYGQGIIDNSTILVRNSEMKFLNLIIIILVFFSYQAEAQELYDPEIFETIEIDFYNDNWKAVLTESWNEKTKLREPASIKYGSEIVLDSVAVRFKGNSTFSIANDIGNAKVPYNLDINDYVDKELLGYNKIKLANAFFDASFVREALAYNIYRKYMPASLSNHISLYVQGDFLGVYSMSESVNKQFLKKHFDYSKGSFFKCDPVLQFGDNGEWTPPDLAWYGEDSTSYQTRYELKSDTGWNDLVELIRTIEFDPGNIDQLLNVDRALWYMAVSNVIANLDSYPGFYIHNYYLFKHENGLWQFLPWDTSEAFIGALINSASYNNLISWDLFQDDASNPNTLPLTKALFSNPVYKKQYVAHIKTIIEESMGVNDIREQAQNIQDRIRPMTEQDDNAFFSFGDTFMESNVEQTTNLIFFRTAGIISTIVDRLDYINGLPEFNTVDPMIISVDQDIKVPDSETKVTITVIAENANELDLMVSTNKWASHFEAYTMARIGDNEYSAMIPDFPEETNVKYYIRAQNETSMKLMPVRAEYEFFEYTVSALSQVKDEEARHIRISPNPTDDKFTIELHPAGKNEILKIYDELGQKVKEQKLPAYATSFTISLESMPRGNYYISLNSSLAIYKLVKL